MHISAIAVLFVLIILAVASLFLSLFFFVRWRKKMIDNARILFESNPVPLLIIKKKDFKIYQTNEAAIYFFGFSAEELVGAAFSILWEKQEFRLMETLTEISAGISGPWNSGISRLYRKNGNVLACSVIFSPVSCDGEDCFLTSFTDMTKAVISQENYRRSENKYLKLIETITDGILNTDTEGRVIYANDRFCEMTGYSRQEITGKIAYQLLADEEYHEMIREKIKERNQGKSDCYEVKVRRKNGSLIWMRVNSNPLFGEKSEIRGHVSVHSDITSHRVVLEGLRESEIKFRNLVEHSLVGVYLVQNNKIFYANPKLAAILGVTRRSMIGRNFLDSIHPEERSAVGEILKKGYKGETLSINQVLRVMHADGHEIEIETYGTRILYKGQPSIIGTILDITERRKIERALRKSENILRNLVNSAPIGVISLNEEGRFLLTNDIFDRITGYSKEEIHELNEIDITYSEDRELTQEKFNYIKQAAENVSIEKRYVGKNGAIVWAKVTSCGIRDEKGDFMYGISMVEDITDIKKKDEELKLANNELNTFIYQASHDLKGPVSSIIGLAELAKGEDDGEKIFEYFEMIHKSANRLSRILQNLLETIKIRETNIRPEKIKVGDCLEDILKTLRPGREYKKIQVIEQINVNDHFYSDLKLFSSILQNLIENALKYHNPEQDRPYVLIKIDDAGNFLKILVEDNGIGIPESLQEKVFEMFYKGNVASKGNGLGLYIVKNIVKKLNGNIILSSEEGRGTVFSVTLPSLNLNGGETGLS